MFSLILWCSVGGPLVGKIYNWKYPVIDKAVLGKKDRIMVFFFSGKWVFFASVDRLFPLVNTWRCPVLNVGYLTFVVTKDDTWKTQLWEHHSPNPGYASSPREHTVWPVLHVRQKIGGCSGQTENSALEAKKTKRQWLGACRLRSCDLTFLIMQLTW